MTANLILGTALQLISLYREAREKQRAIDPRTNVQDDPNTPEREDFLSDEELANLLGGESQALQTRAQELIAKYSA